MSVNVLNFGCRLNIAEGEAIKSSWDGEEDVLVINSCAVTTEAERQARQAIRRAARATPQRKIVVTGCGAEVSGARFSAMSEVARIMPKHRVKADTPAYMPLMSGADHARAFISIQTGCDHDCTFCVIHIARGASRSARIEDVVRMCQRAVDGGQKEVVLTGVDLTSYDHAGTPLGALVAAILKRVPNLPRLRLSSLDCIEIDPLLEELLCAETRLMPHLHLSFQSGDNMILKRMKRRHSASQAIALVTRLKVARPEMTIGADLIAGFPTETKAMFANTMALIEAADIVFGHVFPFSPRPGTPAARMPQIPPSISKARAAALREAISKRRAAWFDTLIGSTQEVLIERDGVSGHAPNFASVRLDKASTPLRIQSLRILGHNGDTLMGTAA